jgi:hypothetical protein
MILPPHDWHHRRSGDVYMYMPRETPPGCVLTYSERVAPLRSLAAHVQETLASDPEFEALQVFMITRFLTLEGEYGARVLVTGRRGAQPVAHVVAAVFAEDFSTRVTARITNLERLDEYVAFVTQIAREDRLHLGVRRRRFVFQPPTHWHVVPGIGLEVALFAPEYPARPACIVVSPAEPIALSPQHPRAMLAEQDARQGLAPAHEEPLPAVDTRSQLLTSEMWRSSRPLPDGRKMIRFLIVLADGRYHYPLRLECLDEPDLEHLRRVLAEVAGTVEPLPIPPPTGESALALWQD